MIRTSLIRNHGAVVLVAVCHLVYVATAQNSSVFPVRQPGSSGLLGAARPATSAVVSSPAGSAAPVSAATALGAAGASLRAAPRGAAQPGTSSAVSPPVGSATSVTAELRTVDASLCQPFVANSLFVSGCTDARSPREGQPWCMIGSEPVLCQRETIPVRTARLAASNAIAACDAVTNVPNVGQVYGCFATRSGDPMMCTSGSNGLQPCLALATKERETSVKEAPPPKSVGLIAGVTVTVAVLLAAAVGLFLRRRARKKKSFKGVKHSKESKDWAMYDSPDSPVTKYRVPSQQEPIPAVDPTPGEPILAGGGFDRGGPDTTGSRASSYSSMSAAPEILLGKYEIGESYAVNLDDEVAVEPGDIVGVYEEFDDGWCSGVNFSRGNTRGVFPMFCIDQGRGRVE